MVDFDDFIVKEDAIERISDEEILMEHLESGKPLQEIFGFSNETTVEFYEAAKNILEQKRYEDAIDVHKEVLKRSPENLFANVWLTAAYSASGREEEARRQAEEVLRLDPRFRIEKLTDVRTMKDKAEAERLIVDLRKAGLK